jgi:LPPG:FO 2-phospho-L-lactate transferase
MKIAALAGGVGGAKFLLGLCNVMEPRDVTIIANTGDDIVLHGLHISPDPDIITYTLAGVVNPETGWGFKDETFRVLDQLAALGAPNWFRLGDRDFATHILRTAMLAQGARLSDAADTIRTSLGVAAKILPMSDDPVPTMLDTGEGRLHLQEYFVRRRTEPVVRTIEFSGIANARPAPGVLDALQTADAVVICPSNPLISIGPILAVPGIADVLRSRRDRVLAICPLVGGKSLKGPTDKMMRQLGHEASAPGVARLYREVCGTLVIDPADADTRAEVEALDVKTIVCTTIMHTLADKERLALDVLGMLARLCGRS